MNREPTIRFTRDKSIAFLAGTSEKGHVGDRLKLMFTMLVSYENDKGAIEVKKRYECELKTNGYRLRIAVCTEEEAQIEVLARQRAAELFKQVYGTERSTANFVLVSIIESR